MLIHPEFWARRRLAIPGEPFELPTTSRNALEDAGFDVIEQRQPSFLYDRSVLITGEVDRVTGFEKGFPIHQAWRGGSWEPDPLILDDQALIAHVAGRGLVVLTGCGHAGIINICRYAQRLTGVKLHAVIGGFHLAGPLFEPIIGDTVNALEQLAPDVIVPPTAPAGRPPTRSPAACPAPSSRTASAPPSISPPREDRRGIPRRATAACQALKPLTTLPQAPSASRGPNFRLGRKTAGRKSYADRFRHFPVFRHESPGLHIGTPRPAAGHHLANRTCQACFLGNGATHSAVYAASASSATSS